MGTTIVSYYRFVSKTSQIGESKMKFYRGKAVVVDYTHDDVLISFWDHDEAKQVSVIVPRELLGASRQVLTDRAATVVLDTDIRLVGILPNDDEELLDE